MKSRISILAVVAVVGSSIITAGCGEDCEPGFVPDPAGVQECIADTSEVEKQCGPGTFLTNDLQCHPRCGPGTYWGGNSCQPGTGPSDPCMGLCDGGSFCDATLSPPQCRAIGGGSTSGGYSSSTSAGGGTSCYSQFEADASQGGTGVIDLGGSKYSYTPNTVANFDCGGAVFGVTLVGSASFTGNGTHQLYVVDLAALSQSYGHPVNDTNYHISETANSDAIDQKMSNGAIFGLVHSGSFPFTDANVTANTYAIYVDIGTDAGYAAMKNVKPAPKPGDEHFSDFYKPLDKFDTDTIARLAASLESAIAANLENAGE